MNNVFKKYAIAACLLVGSLSFMKAQMTIEGTVSDGNGFPAANALVTIGASEAETDFDGFYSIEVSEADSNNGNVNVSIMGIDGSQAEDTFAYVNGTKVQKDYKLGAITLQQVVAIGYGAVKKEDLTGAVDLITEDDFNQGPVVSAQQLIQGKAAGVQITSGGGAPGEGQNIRIRGIGSLSLNSEPLVVIDGVPVSENNIGGSRNILNNINPNDIASISVLKDASATAIYGSRGGNGVIIIETKKGKAGGLKFQLSSQTSYSEVTDLIPVLTGDQVRDITSQFGSDAQKALLGTANTDWQKLIYKDAFSFDNNFSVLGGVGGVPFRASLGYATNNGVLKTDQMDRYTGALSISPKLFDNSLKIELNAKGSYIENQFANRGAIGQAISFDPTQPVRNADGSYWNWYKPGTRELRSSIVNINPLALLDTDLNRNTAEARRLITNAKFDYSLPFIDGLSAVLNLGYDIADSNGRVLTSAMFPSADPNWKGAYSNYSSVSKNKLLDAYFAYDKDFGENSNIQLTAGYSYQNFYGEGNNYSITYHNDLKTTNIDKWQSNLQSFFGRAILNFNKKYMLTATLRADASSKLNPNDRWGYFPSFAASWNLDKESLFSDISWLTTLKLRAGYGEVGNVNGLGDYKFLLNYSGSQDGAMYQFGNQFYGTYRPNVYNPNLKWEISNTINAALDYGFFNNRVNGYIDFYIKKSKDLIAPTIVDPFTNFGNQIEYNFGDMENKGFEFAFNYDIIKQQDFNWSINYNLNVNENKIVKLNTPTLTGGISGGTGNTIQIQREGEAANAFYVYQQIYDNAGNPIDNAFVDRNGDGTINDDDRYLYKDPFADITMGINTNFKYKNFDLSIATRANLNNYVYNNTASANSARNLFFANDTSHNLHSEYINSQFISTTNEILLSDYYIEDASFFRIDNITVGYSMPKDFIENVDMRFFATVNNVAVFTKYSGLDPEVFGGIDNNFYPRPRIWSLGFNLNF